MDLLSLVAAIIIGTIIFCVALNIYLRSLKISNFTDKYILITGCDTGAGNIAAKKLDAMGFHVFAGCLNAEKAKELGSVCSDSLVPLQMDVTDEDSVHKAFSIVKNVLPKGTGLWALINNAGITGSVGLCQWLPKSKFEEPVQVNLLGTVCVTTTFLPLVRRAKGRIVITSSVVGRLGLFLAAYTVSKFCLEGYTDWLRFQLLPQGISVHTLEPGGHYSRITSSERHIASMEEAFASLSDDMKEFYGEETKNHYNKYLKAAETIYKMSSKVDSIADRYIHAVSARHPKIRYVFGWDAHLIYRPLWMVPTWIADYFISFYYITPKGSV